jgi:predicted SAM-dependent methyltransferase
MTKAESIRQFLASEPQAARLHRSHVKRILGKAVPPSGVLALRRAVTTFARRGARRHTRRLVASSDELHLNLGSGFAPLHGWINIDLYGAPVDVTWDLARGVPFPDATASAIHSSHVLEHLTLGQSLLLLEECHRVLRPSGILRIAVPRAGHLLTWYAGAAEDSWADAFGARMLAINAMFYEHGHRAMYDAELLVALFEAAGFSDARERQFQDSDLEACPDLESRRFSLYVEARR